jgi:signal transduction histidine kinase
MIEPRRLLMVEDDPNDAELLRRTVTAEWPDCQVVRVSSRPGFEAAVAEGGFDLILCDYCLPGYDGLSALALARERIPGIPLIFVSGGIGEGVAVESLRAGATDYVLKDRLARLGPAIRRALKEREESALRAQAETKMLGVQAKLAQMNQDLLRKNQEIQNFYHTLSHELKTPLTSAGEFISITMDGLAGPLNARQAEYLGIAQASCNQLRRCINDLLDATRLETGKLTLELKPASLAAVAQRVVKIMERQASKKSIILTLELEENLPPLPLDEHRMTQVMTNLLTNAIKYTLAGGSVLIKVAKAPGCPELVQVSVADTGRGIAKEEQERIFDRLYQVKAGDATTEQGVGLGLYLCRELVHLHGGTIRVESELGNGSTFSFVLPMKQQFLQSKLLVIDDDPEILEMLWLLLSSAHYDVRTARDGAEGLQEMRREAPDMVILDLAMPRLNGAATLKEIRKRWGALPIILYTGLVDSELMKEAMEYSPFTLLAKPCTADQVLQTVHSLERSADTAVWKRNHHGLSKPVFH